MVNAVGDDGYGEQTLANFARHGIDTTHVRRLVGSSGVAQIWVEPDGSNRIIVVPGANLGLEPEDGIAGVDAQARLDVVIGQFEIRQEVTAAAFRAARDRGAVTILNPAPGAPILPDLVAAADWIIPNEHEFAIIAAAEGLPEDAHSPDALTRAAGALGTRLVVTLGDQGAALVGADGEVRPIPAPRVEAVDSTGAGDAFVGAFAYALASGWDEVDAVRLGCAIAADSVTRPGTQTSFPDPDRCRAIMTQLRSHR
jgi:ribokinase